MTDTTIQGYLDRLPDIDYVSNRLRQTYPRGLDTEVLSMHALGEAHRGATRDSDREHVTLFVWRQPKQYRLANVAHASDESGHRWTVDTWEDFELIKRIIEALYPSKPGFALEDCLDLLKRNPSWVDINRHIQQKPVT